MHMPIAYKITYVLLMLLRIDLDHFAVLLGSLDGLPTLPRIILRAKLYGREVRFRNK